MAGMLALVGCTPTSVDTTSFKQQVDAIDGVNGSFVEVAHSGSPTSTQVVTWLLVDDVEADTVAQTVRDVARVAVADVQVKQHTVEVSVIQGTASQHPDRDDAAEQMEPIMEEVGARLGGEFAGGRETLVLHPSDLARVSAQ